MNPSKAFESGSHATLSSWPPNLRPPNTQQFPFGFLSTSRLRNTILGGKPRAGRDSSGGKHGLKLDHCSGKIEG